MTRTTLVLSRLFCPPAPSRNSSRSTPGTIAIRACAGRLGWIGSCLWVLACAAGEPPPAPNAAKTPSTPSLAGSAPVAQPIMLAPRVPAPTATPAPAGPRTFTTDNYGPAVQVAEDAHLFHRADGEWITPRDLADPELVARRIGGVKLVSQPIGYHMMAGTARIAALYPSTEYAPVNITLYNAVFTTGTGARLGLSFDAMLALVPTLACTPQHGEGYQQLTCSMPDGWTAVFLSNSKNFAELEANITTEQARKLIGRNRIMWLDWAGRPTP